MEYIFELGYISKCGSGGNGNSGLVPCAEYDMNNRTTNIDRDTWEPCGMCGDGRTLYQYTNNTKVFIDTFCGNATLVTECMACPPYANCCMKGIYANSAFKINFCPACGRPLTNEAWDKLGKRLRG